MSADSSSTAITVKIAASTAGSGLEIRTPAVTVSPRRIFYPAAKAERPGLSHLCPPGRGGPVYDRRQDHGDRLHDPEGIPGLRYHAFLG